MWLRLSPFPTPSINTVSIPYNSLVAYLVIAGLAGILAAILPARRAARLNVLDGDQPRIVRAGGCGSAVVADPRSGLTVGAPPGASSDVAVLDRANPTEAAVAALAGLVVHRKTLRVGLAFPAAEVGLELLGSGFVEPDAAPARRRRREAEWADLTGPEHLVLVDVADAGCEPLIEQHLGDLGRWVRTGDSFQHRIEIDVGVTEIRAEMSETIIGRRPTSTVGAAKQTATCDSVSSTARAR